MPPVVKRMLGSRIGIVGSDAAKFTPETEKLAKEFIRDLVKGARLVVSGACHLGGIDIWAVEIANEMGVPAVEHPPLVQRWEDGYKPRNVQIAEDSDLVVCITVRKLPPGYDGMRFESCYHCGNTEPPHVKSGGCWTVKYARSIGKQGKVVILECQPS